jgi:glycosyltransferase involved in cell wall biosynthesis
VTPPLVSVVIATHDRPDRLERALLALRAQTLRPDSYEIVVVDDGSGPATTETIRRFLGDDDGPTVTVLRQDPSRGPAAARNRGWRSARAPLVAFTDDDCETTTGWLQELVLSADANPGAIVQGPTVPNPAEAEALDGFSHTLSGTKLGPWFETANILYPRGVLERVGGFDEEAFSGPGGEDTDLAWKAMGTGARAVWAGEAVVHHAVAPVGWRGLLRKAWKWDETMLCFKRHPVLRQELFWGVFWTRQHVLLALALLAAGLPGLPRVVRAALVVPYARRLYAGRRTPMLAPFRLALDLVETAACVRGSLRYRVLVL